MFRQQNRPHRGNLSTKRGRGKGAGRSQLQPQHVDRVSKFQNDPLMAGRLKHYSKNWEKYTSDKKILDTVNGMRIKVFDNKPSQMYKPHELALSTKECEAICNEIDRLLSIGVIVPSQSEPYQFISTIFARPKKDGKYRMLLNFAKLNEHVEYPSL